MSRLWTQTFTAYYIKDKPILGAVIMQIVGFYLE